MALMLELPRDYPIDNLPDTIDVPSLIREQRWDELEAVPVCIDSYGKVTAHFGQDVWDCTPYSVGKGTTNNQKIFSFTFLKIYVLFFQIISFQPFYILHFQRRGRFFPIF